MPLVILLAAWAVMTWTGRQERALEREIGARIAELADLVVAMDDDDPVPDPVRRMQLTSGTLEALRDAVASGAPDPAGGPPIAVFVESGDAAAPFGDGSATHRAMIRRGDEIVLTLRLRHSRAGEVPRVLGYIRPQAE